MLCRFEFRIVKALALTFFDICRLRIGPQALPSSPFLLCLLLGLHLILGVLLSLFDMTFSDALLLATSGTLLLLAFIYLLLVATKKNARFVRTATAVAGCEIFLGFLIFPVMVWFYSGTEQELAGLLSLLIVFWSIAIMAHILRHALDISIATSIPLAIGYLIAGSWVANLFSG